MIAVMADILIVDDDELLCGAIEKKITRLGHAGASVHTLRDAYEKSLAGDYDIIFLDVRMPDGNGLEILPRLKAVSSSPEIIIITGAGDPDGAELAIKSGAWCYLEKPTIIRDLILPLTRALQYRSEKNKTATVRLKRPESVRYPGFSLKIVGREKISTPRSPKIYILPAYCW